MAIEDGIDAEALRERTRLHLRTSLQAPLEAGRSVVITHAARGATPGLTTRILSALHRAAGLVDAPLLHPDDAPHRPDGYAFKHAAWKRDLVVESLRPLAAAILSALRQGRVLVAGKIAQGLISRALGETSALEEFSMPHPCRWPWLPVPATLAKLRLTMGAQTPGEKEFARMLVRALSQTAMARWARMTIFERQACVLKHKAGYAALPAEEKERRAKVTAAAYAALPQEDKERRAKKAAAAYASLPAEEKERRAKDAAASYAFLPAEEKERRARKVAKAYAALPAEEKERRAALARSATTLHWQTMSPLEKLRRVQLLHAYLKTVAGRQAWRNALKEGKARMPPETRSAVIAAMHAGYKRRMTAARQAEVGAKRRKAWTVEKRRQAAARGRSNVEISKKNLAKAHEALRRPERMKMRSLARKATTAQAAKKRVLAALEHKDAPFDKAARRALRASCRRALSAMEAGALLLCEEDAKLLHDGIQFANEAGAQCKSAKLRRPRAAASS